MAKKIGSFLPKDRDAWRRWLERRHLKEEGVWLVFFKKNTGKRRFSYEEALAEALCFGWIDSKIRTIDDETYCQRFSPRKNGSQWSERNKGKVRMLVREGKMTAAGMSKAASWIGETESKPPPKPEPLSVPEYILQSLAVHEKAKENFLCLAPGYRRLYIRWVDSAKREETRRRRLAEMIGLLEENRKLGMK
jgi:uncharacterized protein YdeI (YjbR/CyaY-like superfamily)